MFFSCQLHWQNNSCNSMQQHDTLGSLICLLTAKNSFRLSTFASNFGRMVLRLHTTSNFEIHPKKNVADTVLILHSEMNFTAMKIAPTSCSRTLSAISLCSIKSRQKLWIASVNRTKFQRHGLPNQMQW